MANLSESQTSVIKDRQQFIWRYFHGQHKVSANHSSINFSPFQVTCFSAESLNCSSYMELFNLYLCSIIYDGRMDGWMDILIQS